MLCWEKICVGASTVRFQTSYSITDWKIFWDMKHNFSFFFIGRHSLEGHGLLLFEGSRSHSDMLDSWGVLLLIDGNCTEDIKHTQEVEIYPFPRWESKLRSQQLICYRPTLSAARPAGIKMCSRKYAFFFTKNAVQCHQCHIVCLISEYNPL